MRNSLPQFVLGYHGCDLSLVRQLLNAETPMTGWAAVFIFGKTPLAGPWTGRLNVKKIPG